MKILGIGNILTTILMSLFFISINCGYYKPNWQYQKTRAARYKTSGNQRYKNYGHKKNTGKFFKWEGYSDEKYHKDNFKSNERNTQSKKAKTVIEKVEQNIVYTKSETKTIHPKKQTKKQVDAATKIGTVSQKTTKQKQPKVKVKVSENTKPKEQKTTKQNSLQQNKSKQQQLSLEPIIQVLQAITHNNQLFQANIEKQKQLEKQIETLKQEVQSEYALKQQKNDCSQRPIYDYNLLVLTWIPVNCYGDEQCEKDWLSQEDFKSPTIHGFRPYGSSSYYESCFGRTGDPNCRINAYLMNFDIDEALWNVTGLLYEISQYWPALKFTHDQQAFYSQQWVMHGSCYLMNMIEDNPNAYKYDKSSFNRTIMVEYFRNTITKFKKLNIKVEPGKEYNQKQEFAADIGFKGKQTHFVLLCDQNNEVNQIIFCFNRSKLPGKQVTIPCTLQDTCDQNQKLRLKKPK